MTTPSCPSSPVGGEVVHRTEAAASLTRVHEVGCGRTAHAGTCFEWDAPLVFEDDEQAVPVPPLNVYRSGPEGEAMRQARLSPMERDYPSICKWTRHQTVSADALRDELARALAWISEDVRDDEQARAGYPQTENEHQGGAS